MEETDALDDDGRMASRNNGGVVDKDANESEGRLLTFVARPMRNDERRLVDLPLDFKRIILLEIGNRDGIRDESGFSWSKRKEKRMNAKDKRIEEAI
ncbi:hypothetical protein TNCV_537151 [Trichonephila clavipes]|nr:hypothetical protein TNCV_537151 [Trichonephila clavipes]